jgi:hypothetical protein
LLFPAFGRQIAKFLGSRLPLLVLCEKICANAILFAFRVRQRFDRGAILRVEPEAIAVITVPLAEVLHGRTRRNIPCLRAAELRLGRLGLQERGFHFAKMLSCLPLLVHRLCHCLPRRTDSLADLLNLSGCAGTLIFRHNLSP